MTMSERARRPRKSEITLAEFERLVAEKGEEYRLEVSGGMLVRERRARGGLHGRILVRLARRLDEFVDTHGLGAVWADTHFRLAAEPSVIRRPDVAFIASERIPTIFGSDIIPVIPDLAVEITSRSNDVSGMQKKLLEYLDSGVRAVWLLDPRTRSAMIYRSRTLIELLDGNAVLDGGDVLHGFTLPLTELYSL